MPFVGITCVLRNGIVLGFDLAVWANAGPEVVSAAATSALPVNFRPNILTVIVLSKQLRVMDQTMISEQRTVCQILLLYDLER